MAAYIDKERSYLANIRCPLCVCDEQTPGDPQDPNFPGGFPRECPLNNISQINRLALQHVSQYISSKRPSDTLKAAINYIYNHSYQPNCVHKLLADLSQRVLQYSSDIRGQTITTDIQVLYIR